MRDRLNNQLAEGDVIVHFDRNVSYIGLVVKVNHFSAGYVLIAPHSSAKVYFIRAKNRVVRVEVNPKDKYSHWDSNYTDPGDEVPTYGEIITRVLNKYKSRQ